MATPRVFFGRAPLLLAVVALVAVGCAQTPVTGRTQFMLVPEERDAEIGEQAYEQILAEETIAHNHPANEHLQRVGRRVAEVSERPDYEWEFTMVESDQVNAWALPGGKIAFYTGILPILENEGGMATVMAHEVAHALARHGAERMSQQVAIRFGGELLAASLGQMAPANRNLVLGAYGLGTTVGVALPYSRKHEAEADHIGLILMARAGYDPEEAVAFWSRMAEKAGDKPPEILSTHPADETRIRNLEELMPEAKQIYEDAPVQRGKGERLPY